MPAPTTRPISKAFMFTVDITTALVTEPPLIWLVRGMGLAFFALAAVWLADFINLTNQGKDSDHADG